MNSLEVHGQWWLPADPDHTVRGTLRFSHDSGAELVVSPPLRDLWDGQQGSASITESMLTEARNYGRIHGRDEWNGYTLDGCFSRHRSTILPSSVGNETIRADRVFKGALFDATDAFEGTAVTVGIAHLAEWLNETGISEEFQWSEQPAGADPRLRLDAVRLPDRVVTTSAGHTVTLQHRVGVAGDALVARSLTQRFSWRIEASTVTSFDDLTEVAGDIQALVAIAANRAAGFTGVTLWHPDVYRESDDGRRVPHPIDVFAQWTARDTEGKRVWPHDFLFSFADLGGIEGVRRWVDGVAPYRGPLSRAVAGLYARDMYVSDRFFNCAAALDGLDRARHGDSKKRIYYETRLVRCAQFAGPVFSNLVGDIRPWAKTVKDLRNELAHHLGQQQKGGEATFYIGQSTYWLVVLCLLRLGGAPDNLFERIEQHQRFKWLAPRVQSVM